MEQKENKARLQFENFVVPEFYAQKIVDDSGFENIFDLEPRAVISRKEKQFHISIAIELVDLDSGIKINMLGIGVFSYDVGNEEELLSYMGLNGPAIVFPYLRSFISTYTANSGLNTVTIPTLNLSMFKQSIIENIIDLDNE
ncbi:protein-export chaperone SecB [Myroides odoratimimus]|uniref:protein-export chaperone SecB n=1 Tax=Myroides odoratimimus TaxID=76832 RepID=UPI00257588D3|nr:protein-export chaperone SecB [Myroides odoratimimus]MDM1057879.1 protein-export chaperone SecB [Myroides odoratimimus]